MCLPSPGYSYYIPVTFTSDIILDTQLKFREANRQSIDICKVTLFFEIQKKTKQKLQLCRIFIFPNIHNQ